jgi:hypothetical protein
MLSVLIVWNRESGKVIDRISEYPLLRYPELDKWVRSHYGIKVAWYIRPNQ